MGDLIQNRREFFKGGAAGVGAAFLFAAAAQCRPPAGASSLFSRHCGKVNLCRPKICSGQAGRSRFESERQAFLVRAHHSWVIAVCDARVRSRSPRLGLRWKRSDPIL